MSNNNNRLETLQNKLEDVKNLHDLIHLFDSMGFFAIKEAVLEYFLTRKDQESTLISYAQGLITALIKEASHNSSTQPRKALTASMRTAFTPA